MTEATPKKSRATLTLVSTFGERIDEGQRNIASALRHELNSFYDITAFRPRLTPIGVARDLIGLGSPDLIHVLLGIMPRTALYTRLLRLRAPRARLVLSALQAPCAGGGRIGMPPLLCADGVICFSRKTEALFEGRFPTTVVSTGVDTNKFRPVDEQTQRALKRSHGFDPERRVILHVGQFTHGRNLEQLARAARVTDSQALAVGGGTIEPDAAIVAELEAAGVRVNTEFIPHIEEVYQLADLYLFTVTDPSFAVEMPLSILEALACDLPLVTTDFPGVDDHLSAHDGVVICRSDEEMINGVKKLLEIDPPGTRQLVATRTWQAMARDVAAFYESLSR